MYQIDYVVSTEEERKNIAPEVYKKDPNDSSLCPMHCLLRGRLAFDFALYKLPCASSELISDHSLIVTLEAWLGNPNCLDIRRYTGPPIQDIPTVLFVPPPSSSFNWPTAALLSCPSATNMTVASPEFYEHMPFNSFDASHLYEGLQSLSLNFRNAALLFRQEAVLKAKFPRLESLEVLGIDGPKIFFSTSTTVDTKDEDLVVVTPSTIEGLVHLKVSKLEIALSDIDFLPESLKSLSTVSIVESGESVRYFVPKWPSQLESLDVEADCFGGDCYAGQTKENGKGIPALIHLKSLRFTCIQTPSSPCKITDACLKRLPSKLTSLEIRMGGPAVDEEDIYPSGSPLSSKLFPLLPRGLTSLEVLRWPVPLDFSQLPKLPSGITKLRLSEAHERDEETLVLGKIPKSVRELKIWSPYGTVDNKAFNRTLKSLPQSLTRLSLPDLHPEQFKHLPASLTDLELEHSSLREDPDDEPEDRDFKAEARSFPPLKRLYLNDPNATGEQDEHHWPLPEMLPQLEYLHYNSHRGGNNDEEEEEEEKDTRKRPAPKTPTTFFIGPQWKHYSDGKVLGADEAPKFMAKLPRDLKSYRVPIPVEYCEGAGDGYTLVKTIESLPRGLTALSLLGMEADSCAWTTEHLLKLPPLLTFLAFHRLEDPTEVNSKHLPRALRILICEGKDEIAKDAIPPYCKLIETPESEPTIKDWWRFSGDEPELDENSME